MKLAASEAKRPARGFAALVNMANLVEHHAGHNALTPVSDLDCDVGHANGDGRSDRDGQFDAVGMGAAVKYSQPDAEFFLEVINYVGLDIGLGGRGQAQHRPRRLSSRLLTNEAAPVTLIGPEAVPPFEEAVGLVQHPSADLPLSQRPAQ